MRAAAKLWMLAYLLVAGGAPVLDAALGHDEVVAHWEDAGGGQCPATHDADACQLCQLVQVLRASAGASGPELRVATQRAPRAAAWHGECACWRILEATGPRGPPLT